MSSSNDMAYEKMLLQAARAAIAETGDLADDLIDLSRNARVPGPDYLPFEARVGNATLGLLTSAPPAQVAMLAVLLIERILDLEALDKGVPQ